MPPISQTQNASHGANEQHVRPNNQTRMECSLVCATYFLAFVIEASFSPA